MLAYGGERFDLGLTIDALYCPSGKLHRPSEKSADVTAA
jgi:hypothetical protein